MSPPSERLSKSRDSARVLYLDNHLLVVAKMGGQLVQGDRTGDVDLLTDAKQYVKEKFNKPGNVFVGLVHRLDRPASGVVVLARTSKSAERLSKQFRERTVTKIYLALTEGRQTGSGECTGYISKIDGRPQLVSKGSQGAKIARLKWQARSLSRSQSVFRVDLETGRPHQIRLQLTNIGHPIVGDLRHGATTEFDGRNLALHSSRLDIDHPTTRERMSFVDLPADWSSEALRVASDLLGLGSDSSGT